MRPTPLSGSPAAPRSPWDPGLSDLLKRYPPSTLQAARRLRAGDRGGETVRVFVLGVIGRHLPNRDHARLRLGDDQLRLTTDLGLDSLSLLEMVIVFEGVMDLAVSQECLRRLQTVGDVVALIAGSPPPAAGTAVAGSHPPNHQPDAA